MTSHIPESLTIPLPSWFNTVPDWEGRYQTEAEQIGVAIALARENVSRGGGGPFGAAIFDAPTGRLVAVGVNLVLPGLNSTLHAEMVAIQLAETRLRVHSLKTPGLGPFVLAASCDPCAMCLGATLWSGVSTLVTSAAKDDAERIGFDEGPVFPESYSYLAARGIRVVRNVRRDEGRGVLDLYARQNGVIY